MFFHHLAGIGTNLTKVYKLNEQLFVICRVKYLNPLACFIKKTLINLITVMIYSYTFQKFLYDLSYRFLFLQHVSGAILTLFFNSGMWLANVGTSADCHVFTRFLSYLRFPIIHIIRYIYCDAPNKADKSHRSADGSLGASKGFPTPVTSPLMPSKPSRMEVRPYAWRRKEVCMHIRILKPLETKKEEENHRKDGEVTAPHLIHEKTMTSLSLSRQKSEGKEQQCSVNTERIKSETNQLVHVYPYTTNIYTESRKEQREIKFKRLKSANCQNANDVMDDGINRGGNINRLVARECYATTKHSFSHIKEFLKTTLNISKQSLVQLAIIFAVVINLIGNGLNMNLLKLVCIAGLAVVVCQECGRTRCAGTALETITFTVNVFGGKHIMHIYSPSRTFMLLGLTILIYIPEILNLNTGS